MKNKDVCNYIKNSNLTENRIKKGEKYYADKLSELGYGQNSGGYLIGCEDKSKSISQESHFLNHYSKHENKSPSYANLYCPQLMLWVAEIAGLKKEYLEKAYNYIIDFEDKNGIKDSKKNGEYLRNCKKEFEDFKSIIKISEINDIIKKSTSWEDVISEVEKL